MNQLTLQDFSVSRGQRQVVPPVDLDLPGTGIIAVIGPNGAGKSTMLQAIAGVLPHEGQVRLEGAAITRHQIGFLPQDFTVKSALTVEEVVLLGRRERLGWRISPVDRDAALEALERLGLLHLAPRRMDSLSGGQQQLVLLAQRLSRAPRLLILDEPTSALDLHHQLEVLTHLRTHSTATETLVMVALHDLSLAGRFADRVVLLADGRVVACGEPEQVLGNGQLDQVYRIRTEVLISKEKHAIVVPHLLASH